MGETGTLPRRPCKLPREVVATEGGPQPPQPRGCGADRGSCHEVKRKTWFIPNGQSEQGAFWVDPLKAEWGVGFP